MREARVGAEEFHRLLPRRSDQIGALLEHRDRSLHPGEALHIAEHTLCESLGAARGELEAHRPDDPADELAHRAVGARANDLGGEQQRHPDRDPQNCEQLVRQVSPAGERGREG